MEFTITLNRKFIVLLSTTDLEAKVANSKVEVEENAVAKVSNAQLSTALLNALNATDVDGKSSEEITEKDLQEVRTALEKELPKKQVEKVLGAFSKFTDNPEKQIDGFVSGERSNFIDCVIELFRFIFML